MKILWYLLIAATCLAGQMWAAYFGLGPITPSPMMTILSFLKFTTKHWAGNILMNSATIDMEMTSVMDLRRQFSSRNERAANIEQASNISIFI